MRILTISSTRNKVILARDAQKAAGRLLASGKCFNYNLTVLQQVQHQAAFLMGPVLGGALVLSPSKSLPKTFPLSIPGWWQSRTWPLASCLLSASHVTQLLMSRVEVLLVVLAYLYNQRTEICRSGGVPLHIFLPWLDAELNGNKKISQGFVPEPDVTWGNEHWYDQDQTHKTQIMNSWNRVISC